MPMSYLNGAKVSCPAAREPAMSRVEREKGGRMQLCPDFWTRPPNKAPEPTSCSVTSRAIVPLIELKQQNPNRLQARAAPEQAVAHL
jgi:hypothetical protein